MLERLNEALWTCSTGNRFASLFYAVIDPETGEMEFAVAGDTHALIVGPHGCEKIGEPGTCSAPTRTCGSARHAHDGAR